MTEDVQYPQTHHHKKGPDRIECPSWVFTRNVRVAIDLLHTAAESVPVDSEPRKELEAMIVRLRKMAP